MAVCSACGSSLADGQSFCGSCGAPAKTVTVPAEILAAEPSVTRERPAPTPDADGRLLPGTVLSGRYRIVALAGRGGMGQVYRADDTKLGQPVALKFLPRRVERDPARLARLLEEVRIARQISHPNVCRVYDVGEVEGRHFLSMEYIDGEDLASLLRRIGRLPPEKAVQIARQLCAGLAAAHEQGVLHRDLKPANVMIDGRGRARLTDFGLAVLQDRVPQEQEAIRSGTPAYMAPEQLEGREVTLRSDLYALGLVLYEVFSGRRPFDTGASREALRERRGQLPETPSSHVEGLDPSVERAILRCLEPDPAARPASAHAVAAALPGSDPLAAALAAGETPSPELVASASERGTLQPRVALAILASTVVVWAAVAAGSGWALAATPLRRSPAVLADRARELLGQLGYRQEPADRAWGYHYDREVLAKLGGRPAPELVRAASSGWAPPVRFWYRESAEHLIPSVGARVTASEPPVEQAGARLIETSVTGRLLSMRAVPGGTTAPRAPGGTSSSTSPSQPAVPSTPARSPNWRPLLEAAGLDPQQLSSAPPLSIPPDFADAQAAWTGPAPDAGGRLELNVRAEAAALGGVPVHFRLTPEGEGAVAPPEPPARTRVFFLLLFTLFTSILAAAAWLARGNLRSGRGDRKGAARVAVFVFATILVGWLAAGSHAPALPEFFLLLRALASSLTGACVAWLLYVALEPLLRKSSPASLVSWSRLLAGRPRDPLVGRDLLLGSLAGAGYVGLTTLLNVWLAWSGADPVPYPGGVENLYGMRGLVEAVSRALYVSSLQAMGFLVLWRLFSALLRSDRRGAIGLWALLTFGLGVRLGPDTGILLLMAATGIMAFVIARLGLLATAATLWVFHLALFFPTTLDPSAWFFGESFVALLLGLLPAAYGAWVSVAHRELARLPVP